MELESFSHSYGQLTFHVVLAPKYRRSIFASVKIRNFTKVALRRAAERHGFKIHALEIASDHVHIFVGCSPTVSVSKLVQILKGYSARSVRQAFPYLWRMTHHRHLWSRGKFIRSVGNVTADTIRHYINQSQGSWDLTN